VATIQAKELTRGDLGEGQNERKGYGVRGSHAIVELNQAEKKWNHRTLRSLSQEGGRVKKATQGGPRCPEPLTTTQIEGETLPQSSPRKKQGTRFKAKKKERGLPHKRKVKTLRRQLVGAGSTRIGESA